MAPINILANLSVILVLVTISPGNSQEEQKFPGPRNYHKSCGKGNEIVPCNDETFQRFGCCFKPELDSSNHNHKWDTYEEIHGETEKNLIPIEYCDPDLPIEEQCNTKYDGDHSVTKKSMKELYKELGQEVVCAPLVPTTSTITAKKNGRCRSVKERFVVKSDFFGKRLHIRSDWSSETFLKNRKRKACNVAAFQNKKIKELIERYLLCPFDTEYLDKEFNKLLEDAYFLPKLLDDLCLGSPNLEECVPHEDDDERAEGFDFTTDTGKCVCFKKTWRIRRSKDEVFIWNITQLEERHKCTQAAGNACTFNANDMIALQNTSHFISKDNPDEEVSPHLLYAGCDVKGPAISKMEILPDLLCEQDAACASVLEPGKQCKAAKDCKCICAEGYECSKNGAEGLLRIPHWKEGSRINIWIFFSTFLIISMEVHFILFCISHA